MLKDPIGRTYPGQYHSSGSQQFLLSGPESVRQEQHPFSLNSKQIKKILKEVFHSPNSEQFSVSQVSLTHSG